MQDLSKDDAHLIDLIDSGVCPWCQTLQTFAFYGRQHCQECGKSIIVTADTEDNETSQRLATLQGKREQLQEVLDFLDEGLQLGLMRYANELQKDIDNLLKK